jgi:hypothetical protein
MNEATRRGFLATAGVGAIAGAALVAAPGITGGSSRDKSVPATASVPDLPADASGAMAAVIHDVQKGEVALMVQGHQVLVTDKKLVAQLANAFANAKIG